MATGDLHKKLNPHVELSEEAIELRAWLKLNQANFLSMVTNEHGEKEPKYQTWEIAKFAKWNGFSDKTVFDQISHFRLAVKGGHIEHAMAMKQYVFEETCKTVDAMKAKLQEIEDEAKGLTAIRISDRWKAYIEYVTEGIEFQDAA